MCRDNELETGFGRRVINTGLSVADIGLPLGLIYTQGAAGIWLIRTVFQDLVAPPPSQTEHSIHRDNAIDLEN